MDLFLVKEVCSIQEQQSTNWNESKVNIHVVENTFKQILKHNRKWELYTLSVCVCVCVCVFVCTLHVFVCSHSTMLYTIQQRMRKDMLCKCEVNILNNALRLIEICCITIHICFCFTLEYCIAVDGIPSWEVPGLEGNQQNQPIHRRLLYP